MAASSVISADDLSVGYSSGRRTHVVLRNLRFGLHPGQLTCLLGANGTGKSTLLRTLAGAQPPLGGTLLLQGHPSASYTERERSRTIGVVLTDKTQAGGLTVAELVSLGRQPHTGFFGRLHARDRQLVAEAMRQVGISGKEASYVAELSDGERQKAMIAKALVQECPLILLDEPTAFLDVVSRIDIMSLLHRLAVGQHRAVLLSTHDVDEALLLADQLWLLTDGTLRCGCTEDLVLSGALDALFPRSDIRFDALRGTFSPLSHAARPVFLSAADDLLRHWAENALRRNGFRCVPVEEQSAAAGMTVTVRSAHDILWSVDGQTVVFTSFGELFPRIRTYVRT